MDIPNTSMGVFEEQTAHIEKHIQKKCNATRGTKVANVHKLHRSTPLRNVICE